MIEIDTPGHTSVISKAHPEHIACAEATPWATFANGESRDLMILRVNLLMSIGRTSRWPASSSVCRYDQVHSRPSGRRC